MCMNMYVLQVGAALRPAFAPETAPDVTAAACEVGKTPYFILIFVW